VNIIQYKLGKEKLLKSEKNFCHLVATLINSKVTGVIIGFRDITDHRHLRLEGGKKQKKDHRKMTETHK
jgi:hypothetical protein